MRLRRPSHAFRRFLLRRLRRVQSSIHLAAALLILTSCILVHFYAQPSGDARCGGNVRLAMSIQASSDSAKQVPRLLQALWDECNVYAIHIDAKAPGDDRYRLTSSLVNRYPHNVVVVPSRKVSYAGISMLLATLDCLAALVARLDDVPWSFFINLSAADYPLVTPITMRRMLSSADVAGHSFFQPQQATNSEEWFFQRRLSTVHHDPALWNNSGELAAVGQHPFAQAGQVPLRKAEGWVILERHFARHAVESPDSRTLLALLTTARAADEHFFPTLHAMAPKRFNVVMDAMRHIAWSNGSHMLARPALLDGSLQNVLHDALFSSGALIARKFGAGGALQDQIDCGLSGLWGSAGCSDEEVANVVAHSRRVQLRIMCALRYRAIEHDEQQRYESCFQDV